MNITINIGEAQAAKITAWLKKLNAAIDKAGDRWDTKGIFYAGGEYAGAREALGTLGIRVAFDRHSKEPVGIEAM